MTADIAIAASRASGEHPDDAPGARAPGCRRSADRRPQRGERAVHEDFGVREVDELQDAVHHRVAERDERVDRAEAPDPVMVSSTKLLNRNCKVHQASSGPECRARLRPGRQAPRPQRHAALVQFVELSSISRRTTISPPSTL